MTIQHNLSKKTMFDITPKQYGIKIKPKPISMIEHPEGRRSKSVMKINKMLAQLPTDE